MAQIGSRKGAAEQVSLILALIAFVAIGGLLYWLNITAEPTGTTLVPQDTAQEEEPISDVPIVELASLREQSAGYMNLELELRNQTVASFLGDQAFWIGPQDSPFLVRLPAEAEAPELEMEDDVHVRGIVREMSDSVLDAWEADGVISGGGDRAVASFAEIFLEANQVRLVDGGSGEGESGGGEGQSGDEGGGATGS